MEKTIELLIIIMLLAIMAEIYLLVKPRRHAGGGTQLPILVDTSVLMDGRVVDLAKTGFLLGQIIVPRSVLIELQLLADGADHAKRERARFGMDAMKELKDVLGSSFTLLDDATRIPEGVLELTQKGQDSHQAVGYLHDGTMVVVEQAKKFLGQKKRIEIIRSLQTDAGKMMFAKVVEQTTPPEPTRQTAVVTKRRSAGRKVQTGPEAPAKKTAKKPAVKAQKPVQQTRRRSTTTKTSAQREAELIRLANSQDD